MRHQKTTAGYDETLSRGELMELVGSEYDEYDIFSNDESKYLQHLEKKHQETAGKKLSKKF